MPPPYSAIPEFNMQAPVYPMQSTYNQTATGIKEPDGQYLYNTGYYQQDPFGHVMVPSSNVQFTQANAAAHTVLVNKRRSDYMFISILVCLCCSPVPGILAILFSSMATSEYDADNYEGGRKYSRWALFSIVISIVLGITYAAIIIVLIL